MLIHHRKFCTVAKYWYFWIFWSNIQSSETQNMSS